MKPMRLRKSLPKNTFPLLEYSVFLLIDLTRMDYHAGTVRLPPKADLRRNPDTICRDLTDLTLLDTS